MKVYEPEVYDDSAPFWDATRERRFVLPWCTGCERAIWYPRLVCPYCLHETIEWRAVAGTGAVYAYSIQPVPGPGRDADDGPYVVALVDLQERVRMMTNIVGCDPGEVRVGMAVALTWQPLSDGRHLPVFQPA